MKTIICFLMLAAIFLWQSSSYAGKIGNMNTTDKIYSDESHCLVAPEIRGNKDNRISCFCRDAIVDARYVYQNYLLTEKDKNLNGVFLTLLDHAQQVCGENYDVLKAAEDKAWQWAGPEVTREYPSEKEIEKIKPGSNGFRRVTYKVHLTYTDAGGVRRHEDFTALDKLPPQSKK